MLAPQIVHLSSTAAAYPQGCMTRTSESLNVNSRLGHMWHVSQAALDETNPQTKAGSLSLGSAALPAMTSAGVGPS